jgi:hypothetical protein
MRIGNGSLRLPFLCVCFITYDKEKIANYLEESKELLTFAASTRQYVLNLNILIMGNSRQQKAENRVKFPRLLGSVELFMYFCHE